MTKNHSASHRQNVNDQEGAPIDLRLIDVLYGLVESAAATYGVDPAVVQDYLDRRLTIGTSQGRLSVARKKRAYIDGEIQCVTVDISSALWGRGWNEKRVYEGVIPYLRNYVMYTAREVRKLRDSVAGSPEYDDQAAESDPEPYGTDETDWVREAALRLDPRAYYALYASVVDGKKKTVIAKEMGLSRYQVKRLIDSALGELRAEFPFATEH